MKQINESTNQNKNTTSLNGNVHFGNIESITKILQALVIILGIIGTVLSYLNHNKEQLKLEAMENRKFFYQKQFEYYTEAVQTTAELSTDSLDSNEYLAARKNFEMLYWGKLPMVEEKLVESDMIDFRRELISYEDTGGEDAKDSMYQISLNLAYHARWHTIHVWLDSTEIKNYNHVPRK